MLWFKCKHPAHLLHVEKEATVEVVDDDFENITYHLYCLKCGESVTMRHAKLRGGVSAFLQRGRNPKAA